MNMKLIASWAYGKKWTDSFCVLKTALIRAPSPIALTTNGSSYDEYCRFTITGIVLLMIKILLFITMEKQVLLYVLTCFYTFGKIKFNLKFF